MYTHKPIIYTSLTSCAWNCEKISQLSNSFLHFKHDTSSFFPLSWDLLNLTHSLQQCPRQIKESIILSSSYNDMLNYCMSKFDFSRFGHNLCISSSTHFFMRNLALKWVLSFLAFWVLSFLAVSYPSAICVIVERKRGVS